jgi:hypothetical protein
MRYLGYSCVEKCGKSWLETVSRDAWSAVTYNKKHGKKDMIWLSYIERDSIVSYNYVHQSPVRQSQE